MTDTRAPGRDDIRLSAIVERHRLHGDICDLCVLVSAFTERTRERDEARAERDAFVRGHKEMLGHIRNALPGATLFDSMKRFLASGGSSLGADGVPEVPPDALPQNMTREQRTAARTRDILAKWRGAMGSTDDTSDPHFVVRFCDDETVDAEIDFDESQAWLHPSRTQDGFWVLSFNLSGAQHQQIAALPSIQGRIESSNHREIVKARRETIEECARIAEDGSHKYFASPPIAAAIRALANTEGEATISNVPNPFHHCDGCTEEDCYTYGCNRYGRTEREATDERA